MGLRDIGATLPPGFRFYPSDEELVCHYLYKKIANEEVLKGTLVEIDLHTCEPWQLPDVAKLNASEWYFFSFRDRKYATGFRTNRATISGYWKATGKDRTVHDPTTREIVGMRKTLVFYRNRAPNGIKTGWIMHEFRLETPHMPPKEDWVLCRVFHRSKGSESNSNDNRLSPPYNMMLETTTSTAISRPCLNLTTPTDHRITMNNMTTTMPSNTTTFAPQPSLSSTTSSFQNTNTNFHNSLLHHLLHYSSSANHQDANPNYSISDINSKVEDDECGFLWDSTIEESSQLIDGVSSNLAGTGTGTTMTTIRSFEMDNSMVFL